MPTKEEYKKYKKYYQEYNKNRKKYPRKYTGVYKSCLMCGEVMYVKFCLRIRSKYCSKKCLNKSKKGRKQSKEWIENARITRIGKKRTQKTKNKISDALKGEKNGNWRGGISRLRNKKNISAKHREWRIKIFLRDDFTCQECGKRGGKIEAHHIKPFAYYPKLRFDIKNGTTLCKSCHLIETIKERKVNWTNQFIQKAPNLSIYQ